MRFNAVLLKQLREGRKWSQFQAAEKLGISFGTYKDMELKPISNPRYFPQLRIIELLEKGFGVPKGAFNGGPKGAKSASRGRPAMKKVKAGPFRIPLLGKAAAGKPIDPNWEPDEWLEVEEKFDGEVYAVRICGDSMVDEKIKEGDYVIVRREPEANTGEIVLVYICEEEGFTLKKYQVMRDRKTALPMKSIFKPCNASANHKTYEFSDDAKFQLFGVAMGIMTMIK